MLQGYGSEVSDSQVATELLAYYNQDELDVIGYNQDGTAIYDSEVTEAFNNGIDDYDSFSDDSSCPGGVCSLTPDELNLLF